MTDPTGTRRYNVVLVVLDTVRARQLGLYGRDRDPMPALTEFAEDATVFNSAYTNAPWTVPAHASLFTGTLPSEHGCHGGSLEFDPGGPSLAETLSAQEYRTLALSNNVWISDHFGFDRGFDSFYKEWQLFREAQELGHALKTGDRSRLALLRAFASGNPIENALNGLYGKYWYRRSDFGAKRTTNHLGSVLEDVREPFFAFVNYMEGHAPYQEHPHSRAYLPTDLDDASRYTELSGRSVDYHAGALALGDEEFSMMESLYDGELRYLDARLRHVFDALAAHDLLSETIVAIVGDHGENIGDHGLLAHRFSVHDTLLHVPLVVRHPDSGRGERVSDPVDLVDLHNWLLDASIDGADPTTMPSPGPIVTEYLSTDYAPETTRDDFTFEGSAYDRRYAAARTESHKLVVADDGTERLYAAGDGPDFERDGREITEPGRTEPALVSTLREACPEFDHRLGATDDHRAAVESHLETLGYR
ncbi:sulfatase [Halovivax cerinus]|uniref:Sulfatase n=1 Tax=Halovivax cerinus TaxID=1487865 RepID=A0ABD5NP18_9EURY|nr:sulfatase [Halovivax cerinus]